MDHVPIDLAEKTFLALLDPYRSVERVFPTVLRQAAGHDDLRYVGIKDRVQISAHLLRQLQRAGFYLHTIDRQSFGGRAIDINLRNPITGGPMTGSSSGTAINVLLGMNDLGIGTDGGGSVLAPAAALNLYAFMSPLISSGELSGTAPGVSTDGVSFRASIGFMARDLETLLDAIASLDEIDADLHGTLSDQVACCIQTEAAPYVGNAGPRCCPLTFPTAEDSRATQIGFLKDALVEHDVVISLEGPIDLNGIGDTVFGHFDEGTAACQARAAKSLVKAVNMAHATAIMVPVPRLACALAIITNSNGEAIGKGVSLARALPRFEDPLIDRYFRDLKRYVPTGFGQIDYTR